jgi:2-hydroxychromene-2-carboxylate isomerase
MPERHPFNPLKALRLLAALGPDLAAVRRAFDFVFGEGRVPDTEAGLAAFAAHIGFPGDALATVEEQAAKDRLRHFTEEAIGRGVFGVPTFWLDGECFWGDDATGMLLDWLADPALFSRGEMARLPDLPVGVVREAARR